MGEDPVIALGREAGRLDRAEQRHLELLRQRHLRADHIGEDGQDGLNAIDLHYLAHGRDGSLGIALAILDHKSQRPSIDSASGIGVGDCNLDGWDDQLPPGALRAAEGIGDADLVGGSARLLRAGGKWAQGQRASAQQYLTAISLEPHVIPPVSSQFPRLLQDGSALARSVKGAQASCVGGGRLVQSRPALQI